MRACLKFILRAKNKFKQALSILNCTKITHEQIIQSFNQKANRVVIGFFGLIIFALVVQAAITQHISENLRRDIDRVTHIRDYLPSYVLFTSNFLEAESNLRGYLITDDPAYYDTYWISVNDAICQHRLNLSNLTSRQS